MVFIVFMHMEVGVTIPDGVLSLGLKSLVVVCVMYANTLGTMTFDYFATMLLFDHLRIRSCFLFCLY